MVNLPKDSGGSLEGTANHNASCSAEISPDFIKINGNSFKDVVVNGNCTDKMPTKDFSLANGNKIPANESLLVNGHTHNKTSGNEKVNGCNGKISAEEASMLNGKSHEVLEKDVPAEKVPMVNGKNNGGTYLNGSNTPAENGNADVHASDSLCNEDNSDENQHGFIEVINKKKRNKNRSKNHRKRPITNQPPGHNSVNIRQNSGNDKNSGEKTSPTHLSQKQPCTFVSVKSTAKSYSSVLANGQNGNGISQLRNGGPKISDTQTATKCTESNKCLNNTSLPGTCVSVDQLSADITRSVVINDTSAVSCKQSNLSKVEMTDVSAQTDVCSPNETSSSQKECLPSHEVINRESETHSPSDYVDVGDASDESSNTAYCDSVVEPCSESGVAVEPNNVELCCEGGVLVEPNNVVLCSACAAAVEPNYEELGAVGYNLESYYVSNDSGRGDSEIIYDESAPYCCEFPKEKTSQLIGRGGSFKYEIEGKSGVKLWVYPHEYDKELNLVCMIGTGAQIKKAKALIKERFRQATLKRWHGFNPINPVNPPLSDNYLPVLPEGTNFQGVVSSICDPNFFWLQQYGHPHLYALQDLEGRMTHHFNTVTDAPGIDNPTIGSIVAVPAVPDGENGENRRWIRACIISIISEEKLLVRYLDHGGDYGVPISDIRPMRHDFFSMPFFAAQCCLYNIVPTGPNGVWSEEARAEFLRLCSCERYPPIVRVVCRSPECYFVTMYVYDEELNYRVDVAALLITKGLGVSAFPAPEIPAELQQ